LYYIIKSLFFYFYQILTSFNKLTIAYTIDFVGNVWLIKLQSKLIWELILTIYYWNSCSDGKEKKKTFNRKIVLPLSCSCYNIGICMSINLYFNEKLTHTRVWLGFINICCRKSWGLTIKCDKDTNTKDSGMT
jgi:hypothetical protein